MQHIFKHTEWQHIDSPALLVFPELVSRNIQLAIDMIGDVNRLRPHAKTHKCSEVAMLQLQAGITRFKCATIAEAEMLATVGAPDVLLAYPATPTKMERLIRLQQAFPRTRFSCLVDNLSVAESLSSLLRAQQLSMPVYLDLNVGMNRTGIVPGQDALALYSYLHHEDCWQLLGLHVYDGHIHASSLEQRKQSYSKAIQLLENFQKILLAEGYQVPQIVAGGSPTFPLHIENKEVQCSPGTFVYWDHGYSLNCAEQSFEPAAWILTRVISNPAPNTYCLDAGYKSVASENNIEKRIHFPSLGNYQLISQSEEHLVISISEEEDISLKAGDMIAALPYHICPTVALYEKAIVVENEKPVGEWKQWARDRYHRF